MRSAVTSIALLCPVGAFVSPILLLDPTACTGRRKREAAVLRSTPTQTSSSEGSKNRRQEDIILPPKPEKSAEESTFWRSVPKRHRPTEDEVIPCEPLLDADGPLPFGAYRTLGRPEYEPARTCLVTVALDLTAEGRALDPASATAVRPSGGASNGGVDPKVAVRNMHKLIDSGFTSFQIADDPSEVSGTDDGRGSRLQGWAEENIYGLLRRETPTSVMRNCHLMTRVLVPPKDSGLFGNGGSIREAIGASLGRIGGDCIDTVQVPFCKDSPYHLDVFNVLFEMQQEGIIRSISGSDIPPSIINSAEACNFHLDSNQVRCNLLDPTSFDSMSHICSASNIRLLPCSPLAGGLLTDRYLHQSKQPNPLYLSRSERQHIQESLPLWATQHVDGINCGDWERFHRLVLRTLDDISHKHQVSVASVALRWSMQLENLGSVIVGSRVGLLGDDDRPYTRQKDLREVFQFELDEEDIERLWSVSGRDKSESLPGYYGSDDNLDEDELFIPDLSNRNLWL